MTLDKFEYVLAVAEEKNLTKAAKRLYISQPGLTSYINKLEQYLGIKLFDRSTSPIRVTEAGALYISRMQEIQKEEALLRLTLQDMGSSRRVFRIGMGGTRGTHWLPILIPAFQSANPGVLIQLQDGGLQALEDSIRSRDLDVAFGAMNSGYPELEYHVIHREYIYCVIPRSFPFAQRFGPDEATVSHPALIDGAELRALSFLVPLPNNGFYHVTRQIFQQYKIVPKETLALSNLDIAYKLAGKGCGALIINAFDFHQWHPNLADQLAFCILSDPPVCRQAMLTYRSDNQNMDLVERLMDIIKEKLQPALAEDQPDFFRHPNF